MDILERIKNTKIDNKFSSKNNSSEEIIESVNFDIDAITKSIYSIYQEEPFTLSKFLEKTDLSIPGTSRSMAKALVQASRIFKFRSSYKLTQEAIDMVKGTTSIEVNTKKTNVDGSISKLAAKKAKKFKVPKSAKGDVFDTFFREVYQNMKSTIKAVSPERLMLSGSPGSGKCLEKDTEVTVLVDDEFYEFIQSRIKIKYKNFKSTECSTKEITLKISELFKLIKLYENIKLHENELMPIKTNIKIKNEYDKYIDITHFIIKKDKIRSIVFENGIISKTAQHHIYKDINASELSVGDVIQGKKIIKIEDTAEETVYDMTVNSNTHLYKTTNGIIHHNTSSVVQLSTLFGMTLVTIEGAHISEEDIINIPYIITKGHQQERITAQYKDNGTDFEVVNADSALVSKINSIEIIKDTEYQRMLNKNKLMQAMYNKYKKFIDSVRLTKSHKSGFKSILFLDEYFRTGNIKIQNLLRTILNGNIGNDDIPDGTYIIAASNFNNDDGSLDDIALNQQFTSINFNAPSKDDFANYIADKYTHYDPTTGEENESKEIRGSTTLQPEVYNAFVDNIVNNDLSKVSNNVPLSSRRMEQMIVYVNSRVPVKNLDDARALMNFVDVNLTNFNEGTKSELIPKYQSIVKKIILETSPEIDAEKLTPLPNTSWKTVLDNEIDAKIEIGKDRTYPVMLSGLPGVSKTYTLRQTAHEKGLGLITINASTLTIDTTNGLPVPDESGNSIETKFTEPPLYKLIMKQYNAQYKEVYKEGRPYNFILFIDEFTRVKSKQIQNKIRLLLLEKKVNANYPIPDDILIVGAMNPPDSANSTVELTNHTADVIDIIPVELSILDTERYLKGLYTDYSEEESELGFKVQDIAYNVVQNLYTRFKSSTNIDGNPVTNPLIQPYWWSIGDYLTIYISPRIIADMFSGIIQRIYDNFDLDGWMKIDTFTEDVYETYITAAKQYAFQKINGSLDFIQKQQQIEDADMNKFKKIIKVELDTSNYFDVIKEKKSDAVAMQSFSSLFKSVDYNLKDILANDGQVVIEGWLNQLDDYTQAAADVGILFEDVKTLGFKKLFYFINDFSKFLQKINFGNIKGGTLDQLRMILINNIHGIVDDEVFQIQVMDLPDEDFDDLITNVKSLNEI